MSVPLSFPLLGHVRKWLLLNLLEGFSVALSPSFPHPSSLYHPFPPSPSLPSPSLFLSQSIPGTSLIPRPRPAFPRQQGYPGTGLWSYSTYYLPYMYLPPKILWTGGVNFSLLFPQTFSYNPFSLYDPEDKVKTNDSAHSPPWRLLGSSQLSQWTPGSCWMPASVLSWAHTSAPLSGAPAPALNKVNTCSY